MSKEEVESVHNVHKRQKTEEENVVKRRQDFEVDQEDDEDEDFVGPNFALFQGQAEKDDERVRKSNLQAAQMLATDYNINEEDPED